MPLKWTKNFEKLMGEILDGKTAARVYNTNQFGAVFVSLDGSYALIFENKTATQEVGNQMSPILNNSKLETIISRCLDEGVLIKDIKPIKKGMRNLFEMHTNTPDDKIVCIQAKIAKCFPSKASFYYCGEKRPIMVCNNKNDSMDIIGLIMPFRILK